MLNTLSVLCQHFLSSVCSMRRSSRGNEDEGSSHWLLLWYDIGQVLPLRHNLPGITLDFVDRKCRLFHEIRVLGSICRTALQLRDTTSDRNIGITVAVIPGSVLNVRSSSVLRALLLNISCSLWLSSMMSDSNLIIKFRGTPADHCCFSHPRHAVHWDEKRDAPDCCLCGRILRKMIQEV